MRLEKYFQNPLTDRRETQVPFGADLGHPRENITGARRVIMGTECQIRIYR